MKTFINVLYRRILYKIPLKLLLVLLAIFGLLFACTKADLVLTNSTNYSQQYSNLQYNGNGDLLCLVLKSCVSYSNNPFFFVVDSNDVGIAYDLGLVGNTSNNINHGLGYCTTTNYLGISSTVSCDITINEYSITEYTSSQCQSEYNLIPINEVDSSYCQSNNLCPSGGTPSDCPNVGVSNVFINDLFHPGAFNIVMNIPEEIDWDYAYTNSGNNMNIDVVGYNVDYEAMQSVIDQQNYKPTQEDFNNLIAVLGPYSKIIIFFVFLFIVWAWIKKPFKSKKL